MVVRNAGRYRHPFVRNEKSTPIDMSPLGLVHPTDLVEARLQLHWAAQLVGALGFSFVEPEPDHGHLSLSWLPREKALVSRAVSPAPLVRAALRIQDLSLLILIDDRISELHLPGVPLEGAHRWLAEKVGMYTGTKALGRPDHEMPRHEIASGAPFSLDAAALDELSTWYSWAFELLGQIADSEPLSSPVRCWPHHFDVATLVRIDVDESGEEARSIGVGMSPGDTSYPEPYWYVTPWPYPSIDNLGHLDTGAWHTRGWVGAVLAGSKVVGDNEVSSQKRYVDDFLVSSVDVCRSLLEHGRR